MKLKSFGCSFIYGSDLTFPHDYTGDRIHSSAVWPALIAQKLNLEYECYAEPGTGNFKIMCDIIRESSYQDPAIFVINWTWNDRFDYINNLEQWSTLRPSESTELERFYYKYLHSQLSDMLHCASYVNSAIDILRFKNIPFVMTYMDYTLLEVVNPQWHDPRYLEVLQNKIRPYLSTFQGKNFLDWSRDRGFPISESWHPLEEAHEAAAEYFLDHCAGLL